MAGISSREGDKTKGAKGKRTKTKEQAESRIIYFNYGGAVLFRADQ